MNADLSALAAVIISLGTLIWAVTRGRTEVAGIATETALDLSRRMAELEKALDDERTARRAVEVHLGELAAELAIYRRGTRALVDQLRAAGFEPVWTPPPRVSD